MRRVFINNQAIKLTTNDLIGEGGEAEIFRLNAHTALKLFKQADHPQFQHAGTTKLIEQRLNEYHSKLTQFPQILSANVVTPSDCVYDKSGSSGRIAGYAMQLISPACSLREYTQREFRDNGGITGEDVVKLFIAIHHELSQLHKQSIVVGDLNPLNVLVKDKQPYFIDADSMQFGAYYCRSFSPRYTDPRILRMDAGALSMVQHHSMATDWYSFAILLFECLLYVHPYGGVYKPSDPKLKLSPDERLLQRISVFQPDVKYPLAGEPIESLPNRLQNYFRELLANDVREPMPLELLESVIAPVSKSATTASRKTADKNPRTNSTKLSEVFRTDGVLLKTTCDGKQLRFLYFRDGQFFREDGRMILRGELDPSMRFSLHGAKTLCGKDNRVFILDGANGTTRLNVERYRGNQPVFDSNERHCFLVDDGRLFCHSKGHTWVIDEVVSSQTRICVGPEFSFGLITAGEFKRGFIFDSTPGRTIVDDTLFTGSLIEIKCSFTPDRVWIFSSSIVTGRILNRCSLLDRKGRLLASREEQEGTGSWLDYQRSGCATTLMSPAGRAVETLFVATNSGIAVIEEVSGRLEVARTISDFDTKNQSCSQLVYTQNKLHMCSTMNIRHVDMTAMQP